MLVLQPCELKIQELPTHHYTQHSYRVLVGFWLLTAIVLVNSYSSTVVSSLTVPTMMPSITSLERLAASKDISILTRKDTAIGQQILVYRLLNKSIKFYYHGKLLLFLMDNSDGLQIYLTECKIRNI